MSTAKGFVTSTSHSTFIATFLVNDLQYIYAGNISPSVQSFACNNAILTYTSAEDLVASRGWSGKIGMENVTMNIVNGPSITGPLDMPISPASVANGSGIWNQA
jgi:hypothetical protein